MAQFLNSVKSFVPPTAPEDVARLAEVDAVARRVDGLEQLGHVLGVVPTHADLPATVAAAQALWVASIMPTINDYADVEVDETRGGKSSAYTIIGIDAGNITWSALPFRIYDTDLSSREPTIVEITPAELAAMKADTSLAQDGVKYFVPEEGGGSGAQLGGDYSLDEQPVMVLDNGVVRQKLWIDGKPIWRKAFKGNIVAAANAYQITSLVPGGQSIVDWGGAMQFGSANFYSAGIAANVLTDIITSVYLHATGSSINMTSVCGAARAGTTNNAYAIWVEYTKAGA
jgi:hypothetical protein